MNKAKLIETVQTELGQDCSKAHAERAVNAVLAAVQTGLSEDEIVQLIGFGTFQVKLRKSRKGRNPQTGEEITIPESRTVGFKAGQGLKNSI